MADRERTTTPHWEHEWADAEAIERAESSPPAHGHPRNRIVLVALVGLTGAAAATVLPATPGFRATDTAAAVVAAAAAALAALAIVPVADRIGRSLPASGAGEPLIVAAALASAAAAAVHFAVAKMHFEEYVLFGVFFVLSGIAQLIWPVWLLLRRWQPLLVLGAVGNTLIVALWAVDRIWGLPLGPEPWKPEPFAFADTVTSACEAGLVGCCILLLARGASPRRLRTRTVVAAGIAVAALTALAFLSVVGVASSVLTPSG